MIVGANPPVPLARGETGASRRGVDIIVYNIAQNF